ncbi:MAG TPA: sigma-70 family RNA polymerase sigma factor, partial [Polyangiaceae bacterium]|nr:sigma-70 family RNA polymerase sigma factor [Polyangiaceae bacterium]
EARRAALDELLGRYWRPLYAYARRKGLDRGQAQDAVQGFVVQLLEKDFLTRVDPDRGRLRSYLCTSLQHYLINSHEKDRAQKRGGDTTTLSIDVTLAERALAISPAEPEQAFHREWALLLLDRAMQRLRAEFETGKRKASFEVVAAFFSTEGSREPPSYQHVAEKYSMTIPQVKSLLHRSRVRFRELAREEVRETVAEASEASDELRELMEHLAR